MKSASNLIWIWENVEEIGKSAFESCDSLTRVEIKGRLTSIGDRAFADCEPIDEIIFLGGAPASIGSNIFGAYSAGVSAKPVPATPTITVANAGSRKIKISWKKITGASGYEVYRATSKSGSYSKVKTVTSGSTVSYTNTGLSKGKTYYYKVRAYRTVSGKKVYGNYSAVKYAKG